MPPFAVEGKGVWVDTVSKWQKSKYVGKYDTCLNACVKSLVNLKDALRSNARVVRRYQQNLCAIGFDLSADGSVVVSAIWHVLATAMPCFSSCDML